MVEGCEQDPWGYAVLWIDFCTMQMSNLGKMQSETSKENQEDLIRKNKTEANESPYPTNFKEERPEGRIISGDFSTWRSGCPSQWDKKKSKNTQKVYCKAILNFIQWLYYWWKC